jgi:hypothetical protein
MNYPKIAVAYTKIVTIFTDNILETNEFRDQDQCRVRLKIACMSGKTGGAQS